ncbi:MAG: formamidopyrimidine-DNA glycosylase [Lysobacteraceae bacterium]|nr:MAG: formamidopyrimidine-DNA glycosylase [Xanthomonadaceae bacterium]
MPEIPDLCIYARRLKQTFAGKTLTAFHIDHPFVLRSVAPEPRVFAGKTMQGAELLGKRIVLRFEDDLSIVIHLMIAGRLRFKPPNASFPKKQSMARLVFDHGFLLFTEAGSKRRASIHLCQNQDELRSHHPGGIDPTNSSFEHFAAALMTKNQTLKRALTDQSSIAGIGNAYSDEILHAARMSPFLSTNKLDDAQLRRLFEATTSTLNNWIERLDKRHQGFPDKVTAFQPEMAVHGKYGKSCPACGSTVQRIVYERKNEMNYCPGCQTGGRMLADRALSRLLKDSWPKRVD